MATDSTRHNILIFCIKMTETAELSVSSSLTDFRNLFSPARRAAILADDARYFYKRFSPDMRPDKQTHV